ncbi:MAG: hypothetical protein MNPFHGCM_00438 [Gemmatimonadaceae bacterium]|nr:hypothetical protein [Gemmatimonadaceae bacterium]
MQAIDDTGPTLAVAVRLAMAALVGLAVGIEREWSGHASGPHARFAGLRTFLLLGLVGGTSGLLLEWSYTAAAVALVAGAAALVVAAYIMAERRGDAPLDGTTEAAAMVVLALGMLAGLGQQALAAGAVAVVVFALGEKQRLHWLVRRIGEKEMRAGLQFAVLALVVLPALPEGPFLPYFEFRPRLLWSLVLLLSGLNFAAYLARRAVGASRGYGLTGLLGGIVSSTLVTLRFSRKSREEPEHDVALALGVVGACTVLPFRVAAVSAMLDPRVAMQLLPYLAPLAVAAALATWLALKRTPSGPGAPSPQIPDEQSPLRLRSAIEMAVFFQIAISALALMRGWIGNAGVTASAILLGLTNMDALTIAMTSGDAESTLGDMAARSLVVGILSNTVFKGAIALVVGRGAFRLYVIGGLTVIAIVLVLGLQYAPLLQM